MDDFPGMEEDEERHALKRKNSSISVEDGEITDKPSRKKNKAEMERPGRRTSEYSLDEYEDGEVFDETEEKTKEVDDDDIQVTFDANKYETKGSVEQKNSGNGSSTVTSTDELTRANERIVELEKEVDESRGVYEELLRSKAIATRLESLLDQAIKKGLVAESRAESAEKALAACTPAERRSGELQTTIKEQSAEIASLKDKMKSRRIPIGDPMNDRLIEELEMDKKKLKIEVEKQKKKREEAENAVKCLEKRCAALTQKKTPEKKICEEVSVSTSERKEGWMGEDAEEMKRELDMIRQINKQVATIALGTAMKELRSVTGKNLRLEEKLRMNTVSGTWREAEELKKRNDALMKDNLQLKQNMKSIESFDAAVKAQNDAISQQGNKTVFVNREAQAKTEKCVNSQGTVPAKTYPSDRPVVPPRFPPKNYFNRRL